MKLFNKTLLVILTLALGSICVSCSSDDDDSKNNPTIKLEQRENIEIENGSVIIGQITSISELTSVTFFYLKENLSQAFKVVTSFSDSHNYVFSEELAGITNDITGIKIIAENKDGGVTEIIIPVTIIPELSDPIAFTLGYSAEGSSSSPKSKHGITYETNITETKAVFSGKFVMLTKKAYDDMVTQYDIIPEVESGDKLTNFTAEAGSNFTNKYFISIEGASTYYLIEMTNLEFTTGGDNIASFTVRQ